MPARPIAVAGVVLGVLGRLVYTQLGADSSALVLAFALAITGVGFGAVVVSATAVAYRGLPTAAIPRATSSLRIFQQIGASLGVALLAIVLQRRIAAAVVAAQGHPSRQALAHAFGGTFWLSVIFTAAAIVPALLLSGSSRTSSTLGRPDGSGPES